MAKLSRKLKLAPVKRVREAILYDPHTGELFWKWRPSHHFKYGADQAARWNIQHAGAPCGYKHSAGYTAVNFPWPILAHRIAWAIMTGKWSKRTIDHANCDRTDNRWHNLREASRLQQTWNRTVPKRVYLTMPKGVIPRGNKFAASIGSGYKSKSLGVYATPEEAHQVWKAAAQKLHGEFFNPD